MILSTLSRQEVLGLLACGFGALTGLRCPAATQRGNDRELEAWLRAAIDRTALREPGAAYCREHPEEASWERLGTALLQGQPLEAPLDQWFQHQARADFEAGRVERLEGWYLSRTEARLLAAAQLMV
jgi:hypothetical protein